MIFAFLLLEFARDEGAHNHSQRYLYANPITLFCFVLGGGPAGNGKGPEKVPLERRSVSVVADTESRLGYHSSGHISIKSNFSSIRREIREGGKERDSD